MFYKMFELLYEYATKQKEENKKKKIKFIVNGNFYELDFSIES